MKTFKKFLESTGSKLYHEVFAKYKTIAQHVAQELTSNCDAYTIVNFCALGSAPHGGSIQFRVKPDDENTRDIVETFGSKSVVSVLQKCGLSATLDHQIPFKRIKILRRDVLCDEYTWYFNLPDNQDDIRLITHISAERVKSCIGEETPKDWK